jgi:hypothetical protein
VVRGRKPPGHDRCACRIRCHVCSRAHGRIRGSTRRSSRHRAGAALYAAKKPAAG